MFAFQVDMAMTCYDWYPTLHPWEAKRILLSGWHLGAILVFLRSSRRLEQIAGAIPGDDWAAAWPLKWDNIGGIYIIYNIYIIVYD